MREFRRLSRWFSGAPLIAAAIGDTWTDGRVGPKGAKMHCGMFRNVTRPMRRTRKKLREEKWGRIPLSRGAESEVDVFAL